MAKILNIESSSYVCSVAFSVNGKNISVKESKEDKSHASLLTLYIQEILKENNLTVSALDAISVSKGPGSYTGLRIGVSAAKGLCYGASIPLISVCSLQSMTYGILNNSVVKGIIQNNQNNVLLCPMIDARRMEVYSAFYNARADQVSGISANIIDENSFNDELYNHTIVFFGNGAEKCKNIILHSNAIFIDNFDPSARFMSELSEIAYNKKEFENAAYFEPFYLKDFIPTIPKKNVINK